MSERSDQTRCNLWKMLWFDLLSSFLVPLFGLGLVPIVRAWDHSRLGLELEGATRLALSAALGLAAVQAGGMLLGFSGLLYAWAAAAWLVAILAASLAIGGKVLGRQILEISLPRLDLATLSAAAVFTLYLLQATAPPWYRDSLIYHLSLPRAFAMAGGYVRPDDNIFASFPLGWESIVALISTFGKAPDFFPPFNPRLLGAWTMGAAALASVGLARAAGASRRTSKWAALLFLLVPTVFEFGASAYVEAWLVLLTILALRFVLSTSEGSSASVVPAGIAAGLATTVKYPGIAVFIFLLLLLLVSALRRSPREQIWMARATLRFAAIAALVGAPFYLRNLLEHGNPIFPLAFDIFGGHGWDEWRDIAYGITLAAYGEGRELVDFLLLPFRLFTATSMRTGFEGSLGPVVGLGFFAGLGLVVPRAQSSPRRSWVLLVAFSLLWFVFWAFTVQQARFFLVAVPSLLILLLGWIDGLSDRLRRAMLLLCATAAILWFAPRAAELWQRQDTGSWLAGKQTEDDFLRRMLPDSYVPMRELEQLVPEDGKVWLIWMRGYTYYLRRAYRIDSVFEAYRFEALLDESPDPEGALERLANDRITHLLIHGAFFLWEGNADLEPGRTDRIRRRFYRLIAEGGLYPTRSWGEVTLYEVGALGGKQRPTAGW